MTTQSTTAGTDPFVVNHSTLSRHRVIVGETDMMGIVHHGSYVAHLERGRLDYMRNRGLSYKELTGRDCHMAVVDMGLTYKKPAHFDDTLEIETRLSKVTRVTVRFDYSIRRRTSEEGVEFPLLVSGHTVLACVDGTGRPKALPLDVVDTLRRTEVDTK